VSPPETLARLLDFTAARSQFTVVEIHDAVGSVAAV
jgi:hypothetical protein